MDSSYLADRFLQSTKPFGVPLELAGIDWDPLRRSSRWKRWLMYAWSLCWLIFNAESCLYMFSTNGVTHLTYLFSPGKNTSQIFSFSALISHTNPVIFGIAPHLILLCTLRQTAKLLCELLDPVDCQLKRPDLSSLRRYSVSGILWISLAASSCTIIVTDL